MAAGNWAALIVAGLAVCACSADNPRLPLLTTPGANSVPPFSVVGVVTDGANPISDVMVQTVPLPGATVKSMLTGVDGAFAFSGLVQPTALSFDKEGYQRTGLSAVSTDQVLKITLYQLGGDWDYSLTARPR
jgi:hypothetical protein